MKPSYVNEVFERPARPGGFTRYFWKPVRAWEPASSPGGRVGQAQEKLGDLGATFPVEDKPGDSERLLPVDWMPRIIAADHWRKLSEGLLQRGRAINAWLREVYGDGQDLVPEEIVRGSVFYRPHSLPAGSVPVHVYGPDVVHLGSGEYVVLEDNVRVPSGVAYSEAIRRAGMEAMPELYAAYRVAEIFSYYDRLRETLQAAAPDGVDEPNVAVVTRGGEDPVFFEHRRIADALGLLLLTLGDCYVRKGEVRARRRPEARRDLPPLRRGLRGHGPAGP